MDDVGAVMDAVGLDRVVLWGIHERGAPDDPVRGDVSRNALHGLVLSARSVACARKPDLPVAADAEEYERWVEDEIERVAEPRRLARAPASPGPVARRRRALGGFGASSG